MAITSTGASGTLKRTAGPIGLLFASTTSMIDSGWLFGALYGLCHRSMLMLYKRLIGNAKNLVRAT